MRKVIVFGTFDTLHPGHLDLFRQARQFGDFLIVSVARDVTVEKIKGKLPINSEQDRLTAIKAVDLVNEAVLGSLTDPYAIIEKYHPDVVCLGYDQEAFVDGLEAELKKRNIKAIIKRLQPFHPDKFKSSKLIL